MSDNTLAVRITADIVDLQTKFAVAKAEVNGLTSEMNKLAKQSAAGTIDAAGSAQLKQFAGDLIAARQNAAGYAGELAKAGVAVGGFGRSMESGHGSIATATREFRALFDELSSGRTRQTPGTLAIIAQRVLGLGPAALGAVAGVGALVGALGYLVYRAIDATKAIDSIKLGAEFAGNMETTKDQFRQLTQEISKAQNITHSEAQKIIESFARIPDATTPEIQALSHLISDWARLTGEDSDKAAESLAKMFDPKTSASQLASQLHGLSAAQIEEAKQADLSGNANQVAAEKLELVASVTQRSTSSIVEATSSMSNWRNWWELLTKSTFSASRMQEAHSKIIEENTAAELKNAAAIREKIAAVMQEGQSPELTLKTGVSVAEKENPVSQQVDESKSKIAEMNSALEVAKERGDQLSIDKLNAGLTKANEELSALQFGPALEKMREEISQLAATWDGTQSGMLQKQIQIAQATLASVKGSAKEEAEVYTEIARLKVQERQAAGSEIIASARNESSEIAADASKSALQRLEAERDVWAQLIGNERLTANQRIEVQRSYSQELIAITRETKAESDAIARSDANTDIAIARLQIDAKRSELEQEVEAQRVSAAQKLDILRELSAQEFALNLDVLNSELQGLQNQPVEYERVYNQIRELKAKLVADLENLDKEYTADLARQKKEEYSLWKAGVGEIESVEDSLVSNVLTKRKSMSQAILQSAQQLVTKEIENDVKAFTTKLLLQNQQKALEQGGLLYHMLFQKEATAATVQSQAAQTSAQVAGDSARLTSTASSAAAGAAIQKTVGGSTVMADAAKAFSGTYASVSQIPYVGWVLAPIAAGAAFAAVAGYESLASLDVGAWNIPHDMVAQVHEGETIMPKNFAEGWRANVGAGDGGGGGGVTHNYGSIGSINMSQNNMKSMLANKSNQRRIMTTIAGAYRRGAR